MSKQTDQLDEWRAKVVEQLEDDSIIDQVTLDIWIWFYMHSYADFANWGMTLDGWTFREKHGDWLLVLKVTQEETPYVVFVGSSNPTRCMFKVRSMLRGEGLRISPDKFR